MIALDLIEVQLDARLKYFFISFVVADVFFNSLSEVLAQSFLMLRDLRGDKYKFM